MKLTGMPIFKKLEEKEESSRVPGMITKVDWGAECAFFMEINS